jgi:LPXTG-site transpeptidase (sortase) family protein
MPTVMDTPNTPISSHQKPPPGRLQANQQSSWLGLPPRPPAAVFLATVFVVFVLTLSAADSVGFVPNYIDGSTPLTRSGSDSVYGEQSRTVALSELPQLGGLRSLESIVAEIAQPISLPDRIVISAIDMDLPIQNPATKNIDALTEVLKAGPARYVDSAKLGEDGNMLLFGHSSQLPVVRNQMYKAFNNISKLQAGDTISVFGDGKEYLYSVRSVREGDANEEVVDLSRTKGTRITLITCNTLGEKSARWIVEADFVGIVPSAN